MQNDTVMAGVGENVVVMSMVSTRNINLLLFYRFYSCKDNKSCLHFHTLKGMTPGLYLPLFFFF